MTAGLEFRGVDARRGAARAARTGSRAWASRASAIAIRTSSPGGMRKRTALAQMLILDPQILLMDEPFSALDIQTRQLMENELLELWSANRKSVIFITHDLEEAISLSDRVVVLSAGPATHPIGEFAIDLPRPRDVAEIRLTPRFIELHDRIWHSMKEEVLKGYAQTRNRVARDEAPPVALAGRCMLVGDLRACGRCSRSRTCCRRSCGTTRTAPRSSSASR